MPCFPQHNHHCFFPYFGNLSALINRIQFLFIYSPFRDLQSPFYQTGLFQDLRNTGPKVEIHQSTAGRTRTTFAKNYNNSKFKKKEKSNCYIFTKAELLNSLFMQINILIIMLNFPQGLVSCGLQSCSICR